MKKHTIRNLNDIFTAVNENNIDNFLIDLRNMITLRNEIKEKFKDNPGVKVEFPDHFIWEDDGKNDCSITCQLQEA